MRRFAFCLALLFLGSTSAWPRDFSKVEIKVTPVGGSVYMLEGAGGNIAVSADDDGLVMVDDQFAPLNYFAEEFGEQPCFFFRGKGITPGSNCVEALEIRFHSLREEIDGFQYFQ